MGLYVPVALMALYATWNVYAAARAYAAMVRLPSQVEPLARWPRLSVIVPACNEGDTIEAATRAKLESDYPDLEIILVDDRSTDATSEIVTRLAASDPRVRAIRVDELPDGWLGKVHAMHRGALEATGEWLLFSDADVHMAPTLLRRVIATAEERGLDFVGMMPRIWSSGFWIDATVGALVRILFIGSRMWKVGDPRSRVAIGNGVFNLGRRSVFAKTAGFEWLKLEILDDQVFGQMMKRAGARCGVLDPKDDLALHFYRSLGEMMRGLEKNGYVLMGQLRPWRLVTSVLVVSYFEVGPLVALAFPSTRLVGAVVLSVVVAVQVGLAVANRRPLAPSFVPVFGAAVVLAMCVRSAVLAHRRGGVVWRGVLYPLAALRAGQRLEIV